MLRRLTALPLAAFAALVAGCSWTGRPGPAPAPTIGVAAELLAAIDAQSLDAALAERGLASPSPHVRRLAALAVGQSRSAALAPRLRALFADADTGVAANAAFAAGLLVDTPSVAALAGAVARGGPAAVEAAWALGEIGEPARPAIERALGGPVAAAADPTRAQLLYAASKLRPVPVSAVTPHLRSSVVGVRDAAAYALGRPRVAAGVRPLAALAADPDASIRASVARGLARSAAGDSLASLAIPTLRALAVDRAPPVRVAATRSLAGYPSEALQAVRAAVRDSVPHVRLTGAEMAGEVPMFPPDGWAALWASDTGFAFRRALLVSGGRHGRLATERGEWARSPDWRRRAAAAAALGAEQPQPDRVRLRQLVSDSDARVRGAAYDAVATAMDSSSAPAGVREVVARGLDDPDAIVRGVVLAALAGAPRRSEAAAVLDAYGRAALDRDNDARLAALRYLTRLWKADSAGLAPNDRARLEALPSPSDPLERAAGAALPAAARWSGATAPPQAPGFYEAVARDVWWPAIAGRAPRAVLETERGAITVALHGADAPLTVASYLSLARRETFRGTRFHRVVPAFVVQGGDPRGDGSGGPGYAIRDEQNRRRYGRGVVGMALSGPNTGGSQHFITLTPQPHLDGHYTVFGHVIAGWAALDRIVQGDRLASVRVE